ncbi:ubiquitin-like small modifier protein 1 [Natrialbaceae archaeon GCM10025810]|uniref:ubiquitin-like small modifier protein 1 n=1 Tax=Halovalidus salilacus TaxID=3075124 RepID=UPI00361ED158
MEIVCKLYGPPQEIVGRKRVRCAVDDGATVEDVLDALIDEHPDLEESLYDADGSLRDSIGVLANRTNITRREGLSTPVDDGDELLITPPVHGG